MTKETIEMCTVEAGKKPAPLAPPQPLFGVRHIQVLLNFLLTFIAYGIRVNLSVGIVAMTSRSSANPHVPVYADWHDKSVVLSSFFWGYVLPQVAAGQLAQSHGPKWYLVGAMAVCSAFSILLPPMAAAWGSTGVMASRAIQGFCQGFIFPSVHTLLSRWVPPSERSRLGTFVYAGGPFGTVVSLIVTGLISASWLGWPAVFHLYGALGLLWALAMAVFGANTPADAKGIALAERHFIEAALGGGGGGEGGAPRTPWGHILTSLPVWAILVTHCGQNWGFWTLMTEMPSYMDKVMHFDIKSNSYLSALPYFTLWVLSFVFSSMADALINRGLASVGTTRKIFNSVGLVVPAAALVVLGFINAEHRAAAIALLVVAVGTNSAIFCGFNVNHMDISPTHAGTLMGITNCASNVFSLLAPLFVQFVVQDEQDLAQWQIVFCVASIIYVTTNLFFVVFGSGEVQPWNAAAAKPDRDAEKQEKS